MTSLIGFTVPLADSWGMHDGDMGGGWWILGLIGMVAFWGAVIWGIVSLTRGGMGRSGNARQASETPHETLDRRLAAGDITPDEYAEREQILEGRRDRRGDSRAAVAS